MTRWLEDILDTFAPTSCVGCKSPGSSLCQKCEGTIALVPYPVSREGFHGFSITRFEGVAASVVIAFKDQGRTALKAWMASQMAKALTPMERATLVCLPTSKAAYVRRGYRANDVLTREIARQTGFHFEPGVLEVFRTLKDQRDLSASQRAKNLHLSMRAAKSPRQVILVDDVITTGASLLEARRAILEAGGSVVGFVVFAETLRRT